MKRLSILSQDLYQLAPHENAKKNKRLLKK